MMGAVPDDDAASQHRCGENAAFSAARALTLALRQFGAAAPA